MQEFLPSSTQEQTALTATANAAQHESDARLRWSRRAATLALAIPAVLFHQAPDAAVTVDDSIAQLNYQYADGDVQLAQSADHAKDAADYHYSALSAPDFLNFDVGDVTKLPTWHTGDPNSDNPLIESSLKTVVETFKAEEIPDILVAGDLVEGHWGMDTMRTGLFGPTNSIKQRRKAFDKAAKFYYKEWSNRLSQMGLVSYPALGDHELGDNDWSGGGKYAWYNRFKQQNIPLFKRDFRHGVLSKTDGRRRFPDHPEGPASDTAYAVKLSPEVELITLDVFKQTANDVVTELDDKQYKWADHVMTRARKQGVDWLVVQYHTPTVGHVRTSHSSGMMYEGGAQSKLWQMLKRHDVNLVLNGEVHAITAQQMKSGEPVQISHGGAFQHGLTSYLRMDFSHDQVELEAIGFDTKMETSRVQPVRIWQTDSRKSEKRLPRYTNPHVVGSMVLNRNGKILDRRGLLGVYKGH